MQPGQTQRAIQPPAAFARGHGQPVVARLQFGQKRAHAVKKADVVLARQVVLAVALGQQRVFFGRHIRRGMGQRGRQRHADDVGGGFAAGLLSAHIRHGLLNGADDEGGGVEQGAVPVEADEVKAAGHGQLGRAGAGPQKKAPGRKARRLVDVVGDTWIEHVTPAV